MALYQDGTITVRPGSAIVYGTSTSFDIYVSVGNLFRIPGESVFYTVNAILSATKLSLSAPYQNQQFQSANTEFLATVTSASKTYSGTLTSVPLIQGRVVINASGVERFVDNTGGVMVGDASPAGSGTIGYSDGAWSITFGATPTATVTLNASYYYGSELITTYNVVTDYTPNFNIPEMANADLNLQGLYTRGMRIIDSELRRIDDQTGVWYIQNTASPTGRYITLATPTDMNVSVGASLPIPTNKFEVQGNAKVASNLYVNLDINGSGLFVQNYSANVSGVTVKRYLNQTLDLTGTPGGGYLHTGHRITMNAKYAGEANNVICEGVDVTLVASRNDISSGGLWGFGAYPLVDGVTVNWITMYDGYWDVDNGGIINNCYGFYIYPYHSDGIVHNLYGFYMNLEGCPASTLKYGMYMVGESDNYFSGDMKVGGNLTASGGQFVASPHSFDFVASPHTFDTVIPQDEPSTDNLYLGTNAASSLVASYVTLRNILIGKSAGAALTTHDDNLFVGVKAGWKLTNNRNIILGNLSVQGTSIDAENVIIGHNILVREESMASVGQNVVIGFEAMKNGRAGTQYNTFIGYQAALMVGQNCSDNIAIGDSAFSSYSATLLDAVTKNVAIGAEALSYFGDGPGVGGSYNTAIGYYSHGSLQSGGYNTAVGDEAFANATKGSYNVGIGYFAGLDAGGHGGVYIGAHAGTGDTAGSKLYIDNKAATKLSAFLYGEFANRYMKVEASLVVTGNLDVAASRYGVIMRSPDGTAWRISITNTGTVLTATV